MHEPGGSSVVVDGWGPVADEVLAQLRRCGVRVRGGPHAADAAELVAPGEVPAAVVLVAQGRAPGWAGAPWQARGVPHLPVVLGPGDLVVGPLVLPGRTPCLRCTGPAWSGSSVTAADEVPAGALLLSAAVVAVTVLGVIRGDASLGGISTELSLHGLRLTHRVWGPRPGCRCVGVRMAG